MVTCCVTPSLPPKVILKIAFVCRNVALFYLFIFFRIIKDYHLKASQIYSLAGRKLAFDGRLADIEQLVSCVQRSGASETNSMCDDVVVLCVQVLAEKHDPTDVEPLIKLIVDPGRKVSCGSSCMPYVWPLQYMLTLRLPD
jgi:hypothetical protein